MAMQGLTAGKLGFKDDLRFSRKTYILAKYRHEPQAEPASLSKHSRHSCCSIFSILSSLVESTMRKTNLILTSSFVFVLESDHGD